MPKPTNRSYSRYASDAIGLLGRLIRAERIARRMTTRELSERAGISRDLLHRIERGEPGCSIGAVFEAAAIVGVPLFEPERSALAARLNEVGARLTLMPKAVRPRSGKVRDDF